MSQARLRSDRAFSHARRGEGTPASWIRERSRLYTNSLLEQGNPGAGDPVQAGVHERVLPILPDQHRGTPQDEWRSAESRPSHGLNAMRGVAVPLAWTLTAEECTVRRLLPCPWCSTQSPYDSGSNSPSGVCPSLLRTAIATG